jgi:polypeptide N-acetylgalactosaminyltransferase
MSFKCWMCGGRILIHPCSHVAHIFRRETPYKFLQSESIYATIFKNYKRVVLVWLDQYKRLIYAVNPDIQNLDGGDVSERIQLRQKLNCSSFTNYIQMFNLTNFPLNYRFIGSVSVTEVFQLETKVFLFV